MTKLAYCNICQREHRVPRCIPMPTVADERSQLREDLALERSELRRLLRRKARVQEAGRAIPASLMEDIEAFDEDIRIMVERLEQLS